MDEAKIQTISELYCLLEYFPKVYIDRIPPKLLSLIKGFSNSEYFIKIDETKALEEQNISKETKSLLIVFKYNYWSNEHEKSIISEQLEENERHYQEELKQKYYSENLSESKALQVNEDKENLALIVYKEPIFNRILRRIKKLFRII